MVGNHKKIYELGTNRRTRNKRKYSEKKIIGKLTKVVEEEWREELEKKNSLGIYTKFKTEMKEDDYSGSL